MYSKKIDEIIWNRLKQNDDVLSNNNLFSLLNDKNIIIYGAGGTGKFVYSLLDKKGFIVHSFLDINAKNIPDFSSIPIYSPNTDDLPLQLRADSLVLFSITVSEQIRKEIFSFLYNLGYKNIIDSHTIIAACISYSHELLEPNESTLLMEKEKIHKAFHLLADTHSQEIFMSIMHSHFYRDYSKTLESIGTIQYFSPNIPFSLNMSRFIDCGAYVGDTLEKLHNSSIIDAYFGFEPDLSLYMQLSEKSNTLHNPFFTCLFPCGVSDYSGTANFSSNVPGAGFISNDGNYSIPIVKLDDALKNVNPTLIKMDIEGGEYNALVGARELINSNKPDLAICVYHYISDLWRIPNLIHSWNLGYQFYLRAHSSATMETVLYAIVRDEDSSGADA